MKSVFLLAASVLALSVTARAQPPQPPVNPVTETFYGQKVTDNYRYMEQLGPGTIAWMQAQGAYTRSVLGSIAPRDELGKRVAAFTGSFGIIGGYTTYGGRSFYEERTPGSDDYDLVVSDAKGKRKLVDIAAYRAAHGGKPAAMNWFLVSPDGSKVAAGISEGGSEAAALTVFDAATGKAIAGPLDRAEVGGTSWSPDSKTLYFIRLKQLAPGEDAANKYTFATVQAYDLKSEPVPVAGAGVGKAELFAPEEFPALIFVPGSDIALLQSINGVQNERKLWTAPAAAAASPQAPWQLLYDRDDGVTAIEVRGNEMFFLSHKNAPTYQVLTLKAGQSFAAATVLVPADPGRVIEGIQAASDGLYVMARKGAYSQLLRIPAGSDKIEEIALPMKGHIGEVFSDPRQPGVSLEISSWVTPYTTFRYDPGRGKFTALDLGVKGDIDPAAFVVSDLAAKARDGTPVPLSLVQPKGATGPQIVVIEAYGSYGISVLADFSSRRVAALKEGLSYGVCHVRGGGEKGEAWRLGGKDANKPNTWGDIIACGEDLIARGITSKDKLFIEGGSAGGITMGRAMTERPDLFAGVIDMVPQANPLRAEFGPAGPPNIPEFGSITTEQGFKNLYAMDSIQHVKPGVTYPPVLIATGLNDPRVMPWQPAKFAAALMAAGSKNPVLLRIDAEAGHGVGSTKTQSDQLAADWIAFVKWRAGVPGWQPRTK
jgi:prolyl oligopeptidase